MPYLRGDPFDLTYPALIQATVAVLNINGWSIVSLPNTIGATILIEPQTMLSPIKGALTS